MKTWLGVLVDVVTVAVAIAALALVGERYFGERYFTVSAPPAAPSAMAASLLNTPIGETFGVDFAAAERTALVVFREECPACVESLPFYRRLTDFEAVGVRIVFAAPEHNTSIQAYLESRDVDPDGVVFTSAGRISPFFATPTLVIADQGGVIRHAWVGSLAPDAEAEVLHELFGA